MCSGVSVTAASLKYLAPIAVLEIPAFVWGQARVGTMWCITIGG